MKHLNQYITEFVVNKHIDNDINNAKISITDIDKLIKDNKQLFTDKDNSIYDKTGATVKTNKEYSLWFLLYAICYIVNKNYGALSVNDIVTIIYNNKTIFDEFNDYLLITRRNNKNEIIENIELIMIDLSDGEDSLFIKDKDNKYTAKDIIFN